MKVTIKDKVMTIEIEMNPVPVPVASASGKTLVVASSHGNQPTECQVDGKVVVIGFNAYIRR